jgi:hypothetical protein
MEPFLLGAVITGSGDSMQKRFLNWKFCLLLFSLLLAGIALIQSFDTTNDYIRLWRAPLTRMRAQDSFVRSGTLYLKPNGLKFMQFIDSIVPPGGNVTTTVNDSKFSFQNVLQFYLGNNRTIISCPESGPKMISCLEDPHNYITVMADFPPSDVVIHKKLIRYSSSADPQFVGIYVPDDYPGKSAPSLGYTGYHPLLTLLLDLCTLLGIAFLGCLLANLCIEPLSLLQALILSIPLGAGALSWVLFLLSWAGVPLTLALVLITFLILAAALILLRWLRTRPHFSLLCIQPPAWHPTLRKSNWGYVLIGLVLAFLGVTALIISIGRGYSLYDDIAIWSLKGYVMADHHTITAARWSSGHGLAYPLNLSLNVAVFRLISGDLLPGSKLIFFLLPAALFLGVYRFWKHFGVPTLFALSGVLGLVSIPVIYQHATFGFSNLPFTAYLVLGTLWSIEGLLENRSSALTVGGLLLAFAGWTRPEGIGYAITIALALAIFQWLRKGSLKGVLPWLAVILVIPGVWFIFSSTYVSRDQVGGAFKAMQASIKAGSFMLDNFGYITHYSIQQLQKINIWGLCLPVAVLILLLSIPKIIKRSSPVAFLLLPAVLITILGPVILFYVEFFQNTNYNLFLMVSFDRAFFPAAFLFTILAIVAAGYHEDVPGKLNLPQDPIT